MKLIESAVSENLFFPLKNYLMSNHFDWKFNSGTSYDIEEERGDTRNYCLTQIILQNDKVLSPYFDKFNSIFFNAIRNDNQRIKKITKIRVNCFLNVGEKVIHKPHIDYRDPHKIAILFINNSSDSETFIYNERYDDRSNLHPIEYLNNVLNQKLTIAKVLKPKENTMFLFDGFNYHATSSPTTTMRRISIVFNYEV